MLKLWIFVAFVALVASHPSGEEFDFDDISESDDEAPFGALTGDAEWANNDLNVAQGNVNQFRIYRGQSKFAVSLLKAVKRNDPSENQFISPHSIYRALLLAYFGAEGKTKEDLEKAMFLDWAENKNDVADAFKRELKARVERFSGKSIQFNSVDKLYVTKNANLKSHISDIFTKQQIEKVDFSEPEVIRAEINALVKEITQGYIKDLLPAGAINANTNVVLANAAFFKGLWTKQFVKEDTKKKTFNGFWEGQVEMMHVKGQFKYGVVENRNVAFLVLPYKGDNTIDMHVYLPLDTHATAIDDFIDTLSAETIQTVMSVRKLTEVDVEIPKMSLENTYTLNNVLKSLGISNLFGGDADLSGFSENISVSFDDMIHKAKIEVDEEGSTAAAATGIMSRAMPMFKPEPIKFHCNHPFAFTINDRATEEILFAGIYRH